MIRNRHHRWLIGLLMASAASHIGASVVQRERTESIQSVEAAPPCEWPGNAAGRALTLSLGTFAVQAKTVDEIVAKLREEDNIALSFIEDLHDTSKLTFSIPAATTEKVLARIAETTHLYRFAPIAGHVILYPRDPKWDAPITTLQIGSGTREQVANQLAEQFSRMEPALPSFSLFIIGNVNSYVFRDRVTLHAPATVIELLAQLLYTRPAATFTIDTMPELRVQQLSLGGVPYWRAIKLSSQLSILRPGERYQLKVIGVLPDGERHDITATACLTNYYTTDEKVAAVGSDGMVTARAPGEAWVQAENSDSVAAIDIKVVKPGARGSDDRHSTKRRSARS